MKAPWKAKVKNMFLAFNFCCQKLEAKTFLFPLALFYISNLQSMKLKLENNIAFFGFNLQLSAPKVESKVERIVFF